MPWLESLNISSRTANNYMLLARNYSSDCYEASLPYSKALALLDVPEEQRQQFIAEHPPEDVSAAEIKRLAKELKEAKEDHQREVDELNAAFDSAKRDIEAQKGEAAIARKARDLAIDDAKRYQRKIEEMQLHPVVVEKAVEKVVVPDDYDEMKQEIIRLKEQSKASIEPYVSMVFGFCSTLSNLPYLIQQGEFDEEDVGYLRDSLVRVEQIVASLRDVTHPAQKEHAV